MIAADALENAIRSKPNNQMSVQIDMYEVFYSPITERWITECPGDGEEGHVGVSAGETRGHLSGERGSAPHHPRHPLLHLHRAPRQLDAAQLVQVVRLVVLRQLKQTQTTTS